MVKRIAFLLVLCTATLSRGQSTVVTLNTLDGDSQSWNNGSWSASLYSPPGVPGSNYVITGTGITVPNQQQSGTLGGTGSTTFTVTPNTSISPSGTKWQVTVCPQATPAACTTLAAAITGTTQNFTANLPAIRISLLNPVARVTAYQDIEVTGGQLGSIYFNLTDATLHVCNTFTSQCNWSTIGAATGSFAGAPNVVTVGGVSATYAGTDECAALAAALNGTLTAGVKQGGIFNLSGFTGNQVCQPASLTSLNAALQAVTGAAYIQLGCPLYLALPLQSSAAATTATPLVGALTITPFDNLFGCNPASVADNPTTHIIACTFTNLPFTGCTTPQTHEFTITSATTASTGTTLNDRTYMHIVSSGMDLVQAEPVHINGGGMGQNNLNITGAFRICTRTVTNIPPANSIGPVIADPKCPANPTSTDVYVPIENGLLAITLVAGNNNGSYDANLGVTFGSGCVINPDILLTASATQITGAFIRHSGKCNTTPTITIVDPTGTLASGPAPSLTGFTATSAAGNIAGGNCPATCNSIIHGSIPLIELTDNAGTNGTATMGSQIAHIIIDCRQVADCVPLRSLGGNEHSSFVDMNLTGVVERAFDLHTKQVNGFQPVDGIRMVSGKLPNQVVPFTSSGQITVSGGTTATATDVGGVGHTSTGFAFGLNQLSNPACTYVSGTPILIDGVYDFIASCSSTSQLVLGVAASNGAHSYFIPGCDAGTEAAYVGDSAGHGVANFTSDFSACPSQLNFPYTTAQPSASFQLPNWGIRFDTYYFATALINAHTERTQMGAVCGDSAPCLGVKFDTWYGEPNAYVNVIGQYQNRQPTALQIFNDYITSSLSATGTNEYHAINIGTSFNSTYSVCDDNPVGPGLTAGPCNLTNTADYAVEWSILQTSVSNTLCPVVKSTTYWGDYFGCGNTQGVFNATVTNTSPITVSNNKYYEQVFNTITPAGTAVTYNLPAPVVGMQKCFTNSYDGAAVTSILTIAVQATGQFIVFTDGTRSASGGNVTSAGAAHDSACFIGVDAVDWQQMTQSGTWTKH